MSDALRQSNTDKATSALKPDSQKSTLEQAGDSLKSTADSVAGTVQPEKEKSMTQKASDTVTGDGKNAEKEGKGIVDQASEMASNAAQSVQETLGLGGNSATNK